MLIVWYCLVVILLFFFNFIEYLFTKLFKFNGIFFNMLNNYLNFNFINLAQLNKKNVLSINSNLDCLKFKYLYSEYLFFAKLKNKNLSYFLIIYNLNIIMLGGFISKFTLLLNLQYNKNITSFKLDLNKTYTKLNLKNRNYLYNTNNYLFFANLQNRIQFDFFKLFSGFKNSINWFVKYSPSNFVKYISLLNINQYNIFYLRKNKIFNKGRYSRNRQYYRTGVYWCLYVNIIAVIGIYFWFYRFTMNFGYLWWLLFLFISSFIVPKTLKYRLYNPFNLINSVINDFIWISFIFINIFKNINNLIIKILNIKFFKKFNI